MVCMDKLPESAVPADTPHELMNATGKLQVLKHAIVMIPSLIGFLIMIVAPYSDSHNLFLMDGGGAWGDYCGRVAKKLIPWVY